MWRKMGSGGPRKRGMADGSQRNAREESYKTPYVKQREKDLKERRAAKAGTGED